MVRKIGLRENTSGKRGKQKPGEAKRKGEMRWGKEERVEILQAELEKSFFFTFRGSSQSCEELKKGYFYT